MGGAGIAGIHLAVELQALAVAAQEPNSSSFYGAFLNSLTALLWRYQCLSAFFFNS